MKLVIFIMGLFFATTAFTSECSIYEIKGTIKITDNIIDLVVREGTLSERKFQPSVSDVHKLYPYSDMTTVGRYILPTKLSRTNSILAVESIKPAMPDPLKPKEHSFIKEIQSKVKCP